MVYHRFARTFLVILTILNASNLKSQSQNCDIINNPLKFDESSFNEQNLVYIESEIATKKVRFTDVQIAELNLKIKQCNNDVDNTIARLKSGLQALSNTRQDVLKIKDVEGIKKQIDEKRKSLEAIKDQILKDIENISFKCVYIVFMPNIDPFVDTKEKLEVRTDAVAAPRIISETTPTFLSSITEVQNLNLNTDFITSKISGAMTLEKRMVSSLNSLANHFISLSKFSVAHLKSSLQGKGSSQQPLAGLLIINPFADQNYKQILRDKGVTDQKINEIAQAVENIKTTIDTENNYASNSERQILQKGKVNIEHILAEIKALEERIRNRDNQIRELFSDFSLSPLNLNNMDENLEKVLKHVEVKMAALSTEMKQVKEKELISELNKSVPFEGQAVKDIAKKALDLFNQLKSGYSRVEKFYDETIVKNGMVSDNMQNASQDLYRIPETIWLFPEPQDDNSFKLSVVIKLKVTDVKPTHQTNPSSQTILKPEANGLTINPYWPESVQEIVRNMVRIPAGKFKIGSPVDEDNRSSDEEPQTEIQIASFYMSKFEVTVGQFRGFTNETAYQTDADKNGGSYIWLDIKSGWEKRSGINWMHDERGNKPTKDQYNHPVLHISWNDAKTFISWLNTKTSLSFRLPSEAEWEYSCRAGTTTPFYTGYCLTAGHANYNGNYPYTNCQKQNYPNKTVPVNANSYQANPFGLYHMHGNLWEWCEDDYHYSYTGLPKNGKAWIDSPRSSGRVIRGGCWRNDAQYCRSAYRNYYAPVYRTDNAGFRLSLSSP